MLYLTQLLRRDLLKVREVKTQTIGSDERALLLYMLAQHLLESLVEEVSTGVIRLRGTTTLHVNASHKLSFGVRRYTVEEMYADAVLLLSVDDAYSLLIVDEHARIANLATHLAVERSLVENSLIYDALLLLYLTILHYVAAILRIVIAYESRNLSLTLRIGDIDPISSLDLCGTAGTRLLLGHLRVEASLVDGEPILTTDELREVEREAVGVEQSESLLARNLRLASLACLFDDTTEQTYASLKSAQECVLLLLHHLHDKVFLSYELGESTPHLLRKRRDELIHESLLLVEESITIAHSAAQDAAYDIPSLSIARELPISYRKSYSPQVVYDDTHGDILLLVIAIRTASLLSHHLDERLENIRVIV